VPDAIAALAKAMHVADAAERVEELARLGGFERLRDLGIPDDELGTVAEEAAQRAGARANPREVTATDVEELLRSIW
jgi:alcohol dehydrogenase class IV